VKVIWIVKKNIDKAQDSATWIEMTKSLTNRGHVVLLLTTFASEKPTFGMDKKIKYINSGKTKYLNSLIFDTNLLIHLFYYVFIMKPDIVILDYKTSFVAFPFIILRKFNLVSTKFVLDIRTLPVNILHKFHRLYERLFDFSVIYSKICLDGLTVITLYLREFISRKYHIRNKKIGVWTSGVSLSLFNKKSTVKIRLPFDIDNKFIIIYHGGLGRLRGLQNTVLAIDLLKNRYPNIVLVLLGDGVGKEELKAIIKDKKLGQNVYIINTVPYEKVASYIAYCDVGIVPLPNLIGWRVSSPLKLMEYLAMEKPVIVTDIEAHRDVIGGSNSGFFIESNTSEEIARGILLSYEKKANLKEMGKRGRKLVEAKYTWERQGKLFEAYLFDVLKGRTDKK
jgi:glycosyltransferase involved in cell wall biosynthesis